MTNIKLYAKFIFKNSKFLFLLIILQIILKSILILRNSAIATVIINFTQHNEYSFEKIIFLTFITLLSLYILSFIIGGIDFYLNKKNLILKDKFDIYITTCYIKMDYSIKEDPAVKDLKEKASIAFDRVGGIDRIMNSIIDISSCVFSCIGILFILYTIEWYLFIILVVPILTNLIIRKKRNKENYLLWNNLISINRKISYFSRIATSTNNSKTIRLYQMSNYINSILSNENKKSIKYCFKCDMKITFYECINILVDWIIIGIIYLFLIYKINNQIIAISSFLLYVNSINQFKNSINTILETYTDFSYSLKYLNKLFDFSKLNTNNSQITNIEFKSVTFKNVSFTYKSSKIEALKNINLTITNNEKIAIVGPNGSGKSTFIKLLTGLYKPSSGHIIFNNSTLPISFDNFSPVFQDFNFFSGTIKENLNNNNDSLIFSTFKLMEFNLSKLDVHNPLETILYKNFNNNGIELSGGETQKLALCRSKIKKSEILIFDEPTSSLDAIEETKLYSNFFKISKDKTVIYVSHRMGICTLVDRILVISNGEIIEDGSHKQLMERKGKYFEMFTAQASSYK